MSNHQRVNQMSVLFLCLLIFSEAAFHLPVAGSSNLAAIPPAYVPDAELAKYPVIVIGKWEEAKFENKSTVEGNVLKKHFVTTKFVVESVIAGDVEVGEQPVSLGFRIGWSPDYENQVMSYMSTEMVGDAKADESNLWFLKKVKFDDGDGEKEYLHLETYRGIQPTELKPYFQVLRAKNPQKKVGSLLDSKSKEVVRRSLYFISGDNYPPSEWGVSSRPRARHDSKFIPKRAREPLVANIGRVEKLIRDKRKGIGWLAAWTYADVLNEKAIPKMRQLLSSVDERMVHVAVSSLVKHQDWKSLDGIVSAAERLQQDGVSLINQLEKTSDKQAVPILIAMLQSRAAVKAQQQLEKRIDISFPFDKKLAGELWGSVEILDSPQAKAQRVKELAKRFKNKLKAELVGDAKAARVRVTNVSEQALSLTREPGRIETRTPNSSSSRGGHSENGDESIELKPGASVEVKIDLDARFFVYPIEKRQIEIEYFIGEQKPTRKVWAGKLTVVQDGQNWKKSAMKIEKVEEPWPNGNLKMRGQKTNGLKTGDWQYFNEAGDLIRTESLGTVTKHNPEHPNNKGLGKKK